MSQPLQNGRGESHLIISQYSRFLVRQILDLRAYRSKGLPLPLIADGEGADAFSVLREAVGTPTAEITVGVSDVVRLTRCELHPDHGLVAFLFRRCDPEASTPFFEVPSTRALRRSDKRPDEAVAVSAHLFVSSNALLGAHPIRYRAIREEIPSLGSSYIHSILAQIIRSYTYSYTDHHGDVHETHSIIDISGVKSERLTDALTNSSVQQVTLRRMGSIGGMDSEGLFAPREETFKLYIKASQENVPRALAKIKEFAKLHNWDDVVVRVDLPEKRSRNVALERDAEAMESLFVRAEPVDVPSGLEVCTDSVNAELLGQAAQRLKDANWN
jgi:hypothetical protein